MKFDLGGLEFSITKKSTTRAPGPATQRGETAKARQKQPTVAAAATKSATIAAVAPPVAPNPPELTMEDINFLNAEAITHLRSLPLETLYERVHRVSIPSLKSAADVERAKELLRRYGIVIVPNYIPAELALAADRSISELKQRYGEVLKNVEVFEDDQVLIQYGQAKIKGYSKLAGYEKPVILKRGGHDEGMVDVFNVDRLMQLIGDEVRAPFETAELLETLADDRVRLVPTNLNLYLNTNITSTRGFHVDTYKAQIKAFLYISDVMNLDCGPYTYVTGTHLEAPWRRVNKAIAKALPIATETPFVKYDDIIPVLASKGALIVSDQAGSHRGFPQTPGAERRVLVMNCREVPNAAA